MKGALLGLALALAPNGTASAQPPAEGVTHTFIDPVFAGTVFCDSYFQVLAIATADDPIAVYKGFMLARNIANEPICAAMVPTGLVLDVRPLGVMHRDGKRYNAWAVETKVGTNTGFALYLERRTDIIA